MPSLPRSLFLVALTVGMAIGLSVPVLGLGVGRYHTVCVTGKVLGWSGPIEAPTAIAVSPPGGLINFSVRQTDSALSGYAGLGTAGSAFPVNGTGYVSSVRNWTLRAETAEKVFGWGDNQSCGSHVLTASTTEWASYVGTLAAGAAPPGIGERSATPSQLDGPWPSVELSGSYGQSPIGTFTWHASGDQVTFSSSPDLSFLFHSVRRELVNGSFIGLGLVANFSEIGFGVPIGEGGTSLGTFAATEPGGFPGVSLNTQLTYILPADDDQGTWSVYYAGSGSAFPLGGYLFERIA